MGSHGHATGECSTPCMVNAQTWLYVIPHHASACLRPVLLRLNELTESFGRQKEVNMTLYNTARCLCVLPTHASGVEQILLMYVCVVKS